MADLRRNALFFLAALFTLSEMVLAAVLDVRASAPVRYVIPVAGLTGLCFIFLPMYTLRKYGGAEPGQSYMQATRPVDQGLHSIIRHPQYFGYVCLNVTFVLISPHWVVIVLGFSATILFYLYALQEEKWLLKRFGESYQEYMRRVECFNVVLGLARAVLRQKRG